MSRSICQTPFVFWWLVVVISLVLTPEARPQMNPGTAGYDFATMMRDANGKPLWQDSPTNTIPAYAILTRKVAGAAWNPDLEPWNDRYTKGTKKLRVENNQLPPGVKDFPFAHTANIGGGVIITYDVTEPEVSYMWEWIYYDKTFEHSKFARGAQTYWRGSGTTGCTFENNCYGYATSYHYTIGPRGLKAIIDDHGYTKVTGSCKRYSVLNFKWETIHCLWIRHCCKKEQCEPAVEVGLEETYERFACSPVISMMWVCNRQTGLGGKLTNVEGIYFCEAQPPPWSSWP